MILADAILERAYVLAGPELDRVLGELRGISWDMLADGLIFAEVGTGGGLSMLVAETPWDLQIGLTDGEADLPIDAQNFGLVIYDGDDEPFSMTVRDGELA